MENNVTGDSSATENARRKALARQARREEVIDVLIEFAKRASEKGATTAEIAVLPAVASVILEATRPWS